LFDLLIHRKRLTTRRRRKTPYETVVGASASPPVLVATRCRQEVTLIPVVQHRVRDVGCLAGRP
jgi:hypothetical protein